MNIIICSWFVEYSVGVTATIRQSDGPGINDAGSKYYSHGWMIPDSVTFITALHWRLTKSNTNESAIHPYYAAVYRRSKPSLSLSRLSYLQPTIISGDRREAHIRSWRQHVVNMCGDTWSSYTLCERHAQSEHICDLMCGGFRILGPREMILSAYNSQRLPARLTLANRSIFHHLLHSSFLCVQPLAF